MKPSHRRPMFQNVPGQPHLKRFIGFEGDPIPRKFTGLGSLGSPVDRRTPGFPLADGAPHPLINPYDENSIWGTNDSMGIGPSGTVSAPVDPSTPIAPTPGPAAIDPGLSIPFGVSIIHWRNPTTMQSVPILPSTPANVPVLSLNMSRNALVIQNNSTATSPDVAPNFYIGFNAQPQQGLALTLAPLAGILFDIITPRDAIYVLIAGGSGPSQVIQGVVVQGTYAPL